MNPFSEDRLVEQTAIRLIKKVWRDEECHINGYTDKEDAKLGRENQGEVVLKKFLLPALLKINPGFPESACEEAVNQLIRDRSHLSLVKANQEVYRLIRDGATVSVERPDGSKATERVRFIDFDHPRENHFLCVSQFWVVGDMYTKRPDTVLFVNGIPLVIMEFKAADKSLVDAHRDNIRDYKDTIPKLFWYNMGIIISNGIENKFGSLTALFEYFNEWKKIASEDDTPKSDLATIIAGICDKTRLLDITENYILFDESLGEARKIVPRYFQYYGVNRAFDRVLNRKELDGKLGVFWHTQGSGKSYSMVWLSQKVLRKLPGNFTFVIVTDRSDLDRQAYKNFATVGAVYEKDVHAESIEHLKLLLSQDHRQIFTTIQKFQDIPSTASERDDIIVMTDEAHRTQYDRMAQNMRKALPKASFIGFTGTPLMDKGEEKTRDTFGEYVSVYNFGQSVADGATVPLFYENRIPHLTNVNERLEEELGKVMDFYELNSDEEEKVEREFSTFYHLVTREDRLNVIARDIVTHFTGRGYDGKAMVVCIDKKTAARMYIKVQHEWGRYLGKLRLDIGREIDERRKAELEEKIAKFEQVDMALVVSQSQNEIADLEPFDIDMRSLRGRMQSENLEEEFKKPESNLRMVFVCAMWMTGFDVPNLSTLYLDKPLKNHTLMQTIARANRVAEGKKNGLIVDYIGVFRNVQKALAIYAATGNGDEPIQSKDELLKELKEQVSRVTDFLKKEQIDLAVLITAPAEQKLLLLDQYVNVLLAKPSEKKAFLNMATDVYASYQSVLPEPDAEEFYERVTAVRVLASRIRAVGCVSVDVSQVKKDLETLLDKSIQAGEYVIPQHKRLKDLSALDFNALHTFFKKLDTKNIQVESLKSELQDKIAEMMRRNKRRAHFMERLSTLLSEYNKGAQDLDKLFDDLVKLAKDLNEEETRAAKEQLSEEELAVFDLLLKEQLNPDEVEKVKKVARTLLAKLKSESLVLDWREKETERARVRTTIGDVLYADLPEPKYTNYDCEQKGVEVYNFVYEHYEDREHFV